MYLLCVSTYMSILPHLITLDVDLSLRLDALITHHLCHIPTSIVPRHLPSCRPSQRKNKTANFFALAVDVCNKVVSKLPGLPTVNEKTRFFFQRLRGWYSHIQLPFAYNTYIHQESPSIHLYLSFLSFFLLACKTHNNFFLPSSSFFVWEGIISLSFLPVAPYIRSGATHWTLNTAENFYQDLQIVHSILIPYLLQPPGDLDYR